jgi:hypothetical protein
MGALRFLLWTAICVGLGVGLATVEVGGRTPVSALERLWKRAPKLDKVKEAGAEVVEEVKKKVGASAAEPRESHAKADRDAVADIIAHRQKGP